jgi:hypothetical protein
MLLLMRRSTGSLGAMVRAIARPPTELIYLVPIAVAWVVVAAHSNTLVARAVIFIAAGGVAITWLSGSAIVAARAAGKLAATRLMAHAMAAALAVAAVCYLAVESERLIDLIAETVRFGPE